MIQSWHSFPFCYLRKSCNAFSMTHILPKKSHYLIRPSHLLLLFMHGRTQRRQTQIRTSRAFCADQQQRFCVVFVFRPTGGFDIVKLKSVWYKEWPECVEGKRSDSPGGQLVLSSPLLEFRQVPWCWEINEAALALWSLQDTHTVKGVRAHTRFISDYDSFHVPALMQAPDDSSIYYAEGGTDIVH